MRDYIKINDNDNVVVALMDLKKGYELQVNINPLILKEDIVSGHKIALKNIKENENIIKYGYPIGHATRDIKKGEWVHDHNTKTNLSGSLDYKYTPKLNILDKKKEERFFQAYKRKNGEVGIRNELWIVPTVGCVNGTAELIIEGFKKDTNLDDLDNVHVFKHNYGCSQLGYDHVNTKTILADIVKHPNAGGVLVLGLGCENNTIEEFKSAIGEYDEDRTKFLISQKVGNEIEEGIKLLKELYEIIKNDKREKTSISKLRIGLKCGGSDGFSGITGNPLLGEFSDYLVANGGTTILTEVPEMFGAETILMERSENKEVFNDIVNLINDFKEYFIEHKQPIYENPSPGNKDGGITTLEDKSLGCTQKGGDATITDVLKYGERISKNGLNLLDSPGNDLVASTALGAAGCHMVLFTTGRGTPFGSFVPTMKISTNSSIYKLKPHWIDFDAGELVTGKSMEVLEDEFIDYVIEVASGEYVNNEKNRFREIAIFKTGVTL